MKSLSILLPLLIFLCTTLSEGAPHPATSTSALTHVYTTSLFQELGFDIQELSQKWIPTKIQTKPELKAIQLQPATPVPSIKITLRSETIPQGKNLEGYRRSWEREYTSFGFEVLATKNLKINGQTAILIDLLHRQKAKQLRQVIFNHQESLVLLTCLDDQTKFSKSVGDCNDVIKGFQWSKLSSATPQKTSTRPR